MERKKGRKKGRKRSRLECLRNALRSVIDPETGIDIVTMGLVKGIEERASGSEVEIRWSPTVPWCPLIGLLSQRINQAALSAGYKKCHLRLE